MKKHIYKDIIMAGSAGLSGALALAKTSPDRIRERFPEHMISTLNELDNRKNALISNVSDGVFRCTQGADDIFTCEVGREGVSTALWDMGESMETGFSIYTHRIPLLQLTVEICELFGADPLKINSEGCFLLCTARGNEICEALISSEISAAVIGHTHEERGRVLIMGEVKRFLDKPRHL